MSGWSLDNPVFTNFIFYSGILAAKVLLMGPMTGYYRITKKVFANDEDCKALGAKEVKMNDPDVERVRRAHLNDLENIPVFWMAGLMYVLTNPAPSTALLLFRVYTAARLSHTVLYLSGNGLRPMTFGVGVFTTFYMLYKVITTFCSSC